MALDAASATRSCPFPEFLRRFIATDDYPTFDGSPDEWRWLMVAVAGWPSFPLLVRSLMNEGQQEPVRVVQHGEGWRLVDGHHRAVALLLLGADQIAVIENEECGIEEVNQEAWQECREIQQWLED